MGSAGASPKVELPPLGSAGCTVEQVVGDCGRGVGVECNRSTRDRPVAAASSMDRGGVRWLLGERERRVKPPVNVVVSKVSVCDEGCNVNEAKNLNFHLPMS